jgi:hypothetical protein
MRLLNNSGGEDLEVLRSISAHIQVVPPVLYPELHSGARGLLDLDQELNKGSQALNSIDDNGRAPLHWACQSGNISAMKSLLEAGADPNIKDGDGQTPLMTASYRGDRTCVAVLLNTTACMVNATDNRGSTALHFAARSPSSCASDLVKMLLCHGAAATHPNNSGETALHELASSYTEMVTFEELWKRANALLEAGACIEATDRWNYTPALQAVAETNHVALKVLASFHARLDRTDCDRMSVLHLTALYGKLESIEVIEESQISNLDIESLDGQEDTPFGLIEWRTVANLSGLTPWIAPNEAEIGAFKQLLQNIRNRNLELDIALSHSAIMALKRGDRALAKKIISEIVDKYMLWIKDKEFEAFRTIMIDLSDGTGGIALQKMEELIHFWQKRIKIDLFKDAWCETLHKRTDM